LIDVYPGEVEIVRKLRITHSNPQRIEIPLDEPV